VSSGMSLGDPDGLARSQLPTGSSDVGAAIATNSRIDSEGLQSIAESSYAFGGRSADQETRSRVQGDEIDMGRNSQ